MKEMTLESAGGRGKSYTAGHLVLYVLGSKSDAIWSGLSRTFKDEAQFVFSTDAEKLEHSLPVMDGNRPSNWAVVVYNPKFDDSTLDLVSKSLARHLPVIVGSSRKLPDTIWHWKSDAQAKGHIFEVATGPEDFCFRIGPTLKAISSRWYSSHPKERKGGSKSVLQKPGLKLAASAATDLNSLPGINQATELLRSPTGRLDAEKVRELFGLKRASLAALLGSSAEALRQTPDSPKIQSQLLHFERMAALLVLVAKPDIFRKWLNAPNKELDDRPPLGFVFEKRWDVVENLVADILENRGR